MLACKIANAHGKTPEVRDNAKTQTYGRGDQKYKTGKPHMSTSSKKHPTDVDMRWERQERERACRKTDCVKKLCVEEL